METLAILLYVVCIITGIIGSIGGLRGGDTYYPGTRWGVLVFGLWWTAVWSYALFKALD